ncbi:demethylmenaquinone methyltransferase [Liquorilactobacillus mali]|uniref:demethylmenaquinone methyltransferase n=1 Tax=Liquorilactobacillus mali TaxID=1618 RepID=UPI000705172E|nr:demethylmenaquinone methyltransferase [Liquorilactobacillus mali]MDN7145774.1 demethylmenaquinone methyltransferase [Liquorilactobacillus mali]
MVLTNKTPEDKVNSLFDRVAPEYDSMNNWISMGLQKKWRKETMKKLDIKNDSEILDVCCGTGAWTADLARGLGESGHVTGLDFSKEMLKLAETKLVNYEQKSKIKLVQGNAMDLPFTDNSFNGATIGFGLRNVPDASQVLSEMLRVVKPGGFVACLETSQPQNMIVKSVWNIFFKLVPVIAKIRGNNYADYDYLQKTTKEFVSANRLKEMFEEVGLQKVTYKQFSLGAVVLHIGYKKM